MPEREWKASMPFVAPIRLRNCLWIGVLGGCWLAVQLFGTPHLRVSYRWNGSDKSPVYFACDYWGLTSFSVVPTHGECALVVLASSKTKG